MERVVLGKRARLISATSELVRLAGRGRLAAARKLFDGMPQKDTVAWNAMLSAYSQSGLPLRTLSLFSRMRSYAQPDPFSFTAVLAAASDLPDLRCGRKHHALLLRLGFCSSLPVCNSLVNMYGKCSRPSDAARVFDGMGERNVVTWCSLLHGYVCSGQLEHARGLFDAMPHRTTIAWNVLMVGHAQLGSGESCVELFSEMQNGGFEGDETTFASLINACSEMANPCFGCMVHAVALQRGWKNATEVSNSLLSFYAKFGFREDASKVFDSMPCRSVISWNAMIYASMKFGDVQEALSLFRSAPETNNSSWTAMIAGFARSGHGEQALAFFVDMTRNSLRPDDFTYGAALHACAIMSVLGIGRMIHGCAIRCAFSSYPYVSNGLVNMYSKCGDIHGAGKVFGDMPTKDLVSWNTMLFGFALHGWPFKAVQAFGEMLACNVSPDKFTFMGLLMACGHSGLVEQGKSIIDKMESVHGLQPDDEHKACLVDMLSRAGQLEEATRFLNGSSKDKAGISEALLSAYATRGDVCTGKHLGKELINMMPQKDVGYVLLSNLYCISGQWKEAERVRKEMVEQGVKKSPGCSWIEIRDMVSVFVSGIQDLDDIADVHDIIELLTFEMRNPQSI